jgi:hypothetical protein
MTRLRLEMLGVLVLAGAAALALIGAAAWVVDGLAR